ncbi:hypothetical protein JXL19_11025 [bacterium]|nr:hypothetical protein [bacterium]
MKTKYKIQIVFMLAAFLFLLFSIQTIFSEEPATNTISPASLNQWISAIFNRSQNTNRRNISGDQYPIIYMKCATPLIRLALTHPDWLAPENRFVLHRPDNPEYIRYYSPDGQTSWTYDTPEGNFKIHYSETGDNAVSGPGVDGILETIPDYVIKFGQYFEDSWRHEADILGYYPPAPDGTYGGDSRFDIYILKMNYYGYTDIENGHPFIVVHNNYIGFESNLDTEGSIAGNMKITAAHEFFHAIQYGYDDWNNNCIWWEENTAVWMEDEVFDLVDGYLNYLGNPFDDLNNNLQWDAGEPWYKHDGSLGDTSGRDAGVWFEAPHISLDTRYTSTFDRYEYGGVVWAKYLAATFGNEIIKHIFTITDYDTDALPAIEQALQDYGSNLVETFTDFRINVLTLDPNIFEEHFKYPLIRHKGNYGNYPLILDLGDVSHLACRYIGLKPPEGNKKLVIDVDGQDYSNFGVPVVLFNEKGGYDVWHIEIDNYIAQTGRIEINSFGTEGLYKSASIIPINLSKTQNYRSLLITIHLEGLFKQDIRLREGINLISIPMNLGGAISSYDFLNNYFDSSENVHLSCYDSETGIWNISYIDGMTTGNPFDLDWQKGYILTISNDKTVQLTGDAPIETKIDLLSGHNFVSSFISDQSPLFSHEILKSLDPNRQTFSSVSKYDNVSGKWQAGYWFFGRPAGKDFIVMQGEGYMIDMVGEHPGWSPSDLL